MRWGVIFSATGRTQKNRVSPVRAVTPVKTGVQEVSEGLDSAFRKNDDKDFRQAVRIL
jgi:hypothetical protein